MQYCLIYKKMLAIVTIFYLNEIVLTECRILLEQDLFFKNCSIDLANNLLR